MPLTPFIGLSVLVHIAIIIGYHVTRRLPKKAPVIEFRAKRASLKLNRCMSFCIMLVIFVAVAMNAAILLRASILDEHSSIKVVSTYAGRMIASFSDKDIVLGTTAHAVVIADAECQDTGSVSLADFMKSKGLDSSFDSRRKLAEISGMTGYSGLSSENLIILESLLREFGETGFLDKKGCDSP